MGKRMSLQSEGIRNATDWLSAGTVIATLAGWLPAMAALFSIIWTLMRICNEWDKFKATVARWFGQ